MDPIIQSKTAMAVRKCGLLTNQQTLDQDFFSREAKAML